MNYLAEMLRDCSKNRTTSFTEISFPITQEIENKIKNKNINLRKKMKQRLVDMQRNAKCDEKIQQSALLSKRLNANQKNEKQTVPYIDAYIDQDLTQNHPYPLRLENIILDDKQADVSVCLYLLMRKRKAIFKIEEVRRKLRAKESLRRNSLKECDCCERVGRHRCLHKFCEGRCEKFRKTAKRQLSLRSEYYNEQQEIIENSQANQLQYEKQDSLMQLDPIFLDKQVIKNGRAKKKEQKQRPADIELATQQQIGQELREQHEIMEKEHLQDKNQQMDRQAGLAESLAHQVGLEEKKERSAEEEQRNAQRLQIHLQLQQEVNHHNQPQVDQLSPTQPLHMQQQPHECPQNPPMELQSPRRSEKYDQFMDEQ